MSRFHLIPLSASSGAASVDLLFWALVALSLFFIVPIFLCIIVFVVRYRNGKDTDRTHPPRTNIKLEIAWTVIPLFMGLIFFVWAARLYFYNSRPPADALDVYVVAKQWMWKLQHPQGRREINELHVPLGRAVKLTMTSQDVIHDFFVPAFRVKQDVLPGRYTTLWFTPTRLGRYHLFCAEYCGTYHSRMGGWVYVMKPEEYARWLQEGDAQPTMAQSGEKLFLQLGCSGCHGENSNVRAPLLDGIYGKPVAVQATNGGTRVVTADERYLRDSILLPEKEIAAGYQPIMPTFKGRLSEAEILQLVAYIKTMGESAAGEQISPSAASAGSHNAGKSGDTAATEYMRSWAGSQQPGGAEKSTRSKRR